MSENDPTLGKDQDKQPGTERYVDPNSGAAPQPGGYAVGEPLPTPEPDDSEPPAAQTLGDPEADPIQAAAIEHQAAPAGPQPAGEEQSTGETNDEKGGSGSGAGAGTADGEDEEEAPEPQTLGDPDADPARAHAVETSATLGDVQNADGSPKEQEGDGDSSDSDSGEDGDEEKQDGQYDELLSGSVKDVQKYLEKNPEEKDAVVEAEKNGQNRKGIVES